MSAKCPHCNRTALFPYRGRVYCREHWQEVVDCDRDEDTTYRNGFRMDRDRAEGMREE